MTVPSGRRDPARSLRPDHPPFLLARHPEALISLSLPPDSRGGTPPPVRIPVSGSFERRMKLHGTCEWIAPIPIRPRALAFGSAPEGMIVEVEGRPLLFDHRQDARAGTWAHDARRLFLRLPADQIPQPGDVVVRYSRATEREKELNRRWSPAAADIQFALRSVQQDRTSRFGVFLPAPASACWRVQVPAEGRLAAELGMLEPETRDLPPSDGATFRVTVIEGGSVDVAGEVQLVPGVFRHISVDLARWAGREVLLVLASLPGATAIGDYVFAADPAIYSPLPSAPRIVLVFVDTLRADHLGAYGYRRPTSPAIDEFSRRATVFTEARAVAPWTLPSVRALMLGGAPERWGERTTLPSLVAGRGWATAAFVGNVYLSSSFGMDSGWGEYHCVNLPHAQQQVDRAIQWLSSHADRPSLLMLHLMDVHLPYKEPQSYRGLFAGAAPIQLDRAFIKPDVIAAARRGDIAKLSHYVVDRYDGCIRYVDDQVGRLLRELGDGDVVCLFGDHGEEFWEHAGYEHGHSLYDELLRVPLIVKAPGMPAGRVRGPVSLIDVAPTLLELTGAGTSPADGRSLLGLARGEGVERSFFAARKLSIGRLLVGSEQWGVLSGGKKYTIANGQERLFDLLADPSESHDLLRTNDRDVDLRAWRRILSDALAAPVPGVLRISADRTAATDELRVSLRVPGGVKAAWPGADALGRTQPVVEVVGEEVRFRWDGAAGRNREVFVEPIDDPFRVGRAIVMDVVCGAEHVEVRADASDAPSRRAQRPARLLSTSIGGVTCAVVLGVAPHLPAGSAASEGYDDERAAELRALGYVAQ